jgi:hypothetical protein
LSGSAKEKKIWLISAAVVLALRHSCKERDNEFSSPSSSAYKTKKKKLALVLHSNDEHFMRHV